MKNKKRKRRVKSENLNCRKFALTRPEGAEAPSPGHSPWVFMSARLAPCRGKSFIWRPEYDIQAKKNRRKDDVNGFFYLLGMR